MEGQDARYCDHDENGTRVCAGSQEWKAAVSGDGTNDAQERYSRRDGLANAALGDLDGAGGVEGGRWIWIHAGRQEVVRRADRGFAVGGNFYAAERAGNDRVSRECGRGELEQLGVRSAAAFADHEYESPGDVGEIDRAGQDCGGVWRAEGKSHGG